MEGPHEDKRDALMKTMTSGDLRVTSLSLSLLFPLILLCITATKCSLVFFVA